MAKQKNSEKIELMKEAMEALVEAVADVHTSTVTTDRMIEDLYKDLDELETYVYEVRMTAIQFAAENELGSDINLNVLGKLAKEVSGDSYTAIPHVKFGTVGYVPVDVWVQAYELYLDTHGLNTVFDYLNRHGIESEQPQRRAIERIAQNYSEDVGLDIGVGEPTKRHPFGAPTFQAEAIEAALDTVEEVVTNLQMLLMLGQP